MVLLILGALLAAGGFASVIYGNFMNNDFSSQLAHYSSGGDPGDSWITFGVIAIIVGVIMVIYGPTQMKAEKKFEREAGGSNLTSYQRNLLAVYISQLDNGVITEEEYLSKRDKLLNDNTYIDQNTKIPTAGTIQDPTPGSKPVPERDKLAVEPIYVRSDEIQCPVCGKKQRADRKICWFCNQPFQKNS